MGSFADGAYWSSSEDGTSITSSQNFDSWVKPSTEDKQCAFFVRAIRAFGSAGSESNTGMGSNKASTRSYCTACF